MILLTTVLTTQPVELVAPFTERWVLVSAVIRCFILIVFSIVGIIWAMNRPYAHGAKDVHDTQCDTTSDTTDQNTGQKP